ncbi:MAG TPA: YqeG family HAD IIIA-type phosphatase [Firmicutes bacterium]|nr:YqeG family HAD IIIA-type phosphatase [Bacillota bacterium]
MAGKGFLGFLCPDLWQRGIQDIDLDKLKSRGIGALIFDIDNTLAKWGESEISRDIIGWIERAKLKGFRMCILSNNLSSRVEAISKRLGIPAVRKGIKPFRYAFNRAIAVMASDPKHTAVVGDQVFTDILGGNLCGMYTILVAPISRHEFITTRLVRVLEKLTLRYLLARGMIAPKDIETRRPLEMAGAGSCDGHDS